MCFSIIIVDMKIDLLMSRLATVSVSFACSNASKSFGTILGLNSEVAGQDINFFSVKLK